MNKVYDLILPLKKQWFYMIKSGEKPEEYREIKDYYVSRFMGREHCGHDIEYLEELADCMGKFFSDQFSSVTFTLGYPPAECKERRMTFNNPKIRIGTGRPEWGAVEGKKYFVITWE